MKKLMNYETPLVGQKSDVGLAAMTWLVDNWDKWLSVFMAIVVSGITGFFSAVITLKSEISQLKRDLSILRTKVEESISPKLSDIISHNSRIGSLEIKMAEIATIAETLQSRTNELFQKTDSMLIFNWQKTMIVRGPAENMPEGTH